MSQKRVIFITGSSRGIGAATARLASRNGWQVALHGRQETPALLALAQELDAPIFQADVTHQSAIQEAITKAHQHFDQIDALINAAGIVRPKPFLEMTPEDWSAEYQTNVLGTVFACQAVVPLMQEQENGGRIVNVASIRGLSPTASARGMAYSMSKAAIINFTECLAKAYAPKVIANAVSPGFTATDMSKTWNDAVWQQARSALAGRPAEPSEIAEALLFLASPKSSFITGQTLLVDGGYTMAGK